MTARIIGMLSYKTALGRTISAVHIIAQLLAPVFSNANAHNGYLSGSVSTPASLSLSLPTSGDWRSFGGIIGSDACPGVNYSSNSGIKISNYSLLPGSSDNINNSAPIQVSWTNGVPITTQTNATESCYFSSGGAAGITVTCVGVIATHICTFYVYTQTGTNFSLNAHLTDSSATDYNDSGTSGIGNLIRVYTISYHPATNGPQLKVTWTSTSLGGNVGIQVVTWS